jgi:hypothetical protein
MVTVIGVWLIGTVGGAVAAANTEGAHPQLHTAMKPNDINARSMRRRIDLESFMVFFQLKQG